MKNSIKSFLLICILIVTISSCKKEKNPQPDVTPTESPCIQLKAGNYWIYENGTVDSNGVVSNVQIDSFYITKDTVIKNKTYYIQKSLTAQFIVSYLRDSSGYLLGIDGKPLFAENNFTDILRVDSVYIGGSNAIGYAIGYGISKMANKDSVITVPAGTFSTRNFRTAFILFPPYNTQPNPRYSNTLYAHGVGRVLQTARSINGNIVVYQKLLRYHIQP